MADPGFSRGGGDNSQVGVILQIFFVENCMKMKEFGPLGLILETSERREINIQTEKESFEILLGIK